MSHDPILHKIEYLRTASGIRSGRPDILVAAAVQEAMNIYEWCRNDREKLEGAGLDWSYAEDLPVRAETLLRLHSEWNVEHNNRKDYQEEWKSARILAREMKKELLHHFYHAFNRNLSANDAAKRISIGRSNAKLIQCLSDLAELGSNNKADLERIGMDLDLLDKAREESIRLNKLHGRANAMKNIGSERLELRNKAFYHLKEAVNMVREAGRYVFDKNDKRYEGYLSKFIKKKKQKLKNRKK